MVAQWIFQPMRRRWAVSVEFVPPEVSHARFDRALWSGASADRKRGSGVETMNPWSYAAGDVETYRRKLIEAYHGIELASLFAMIAAMGRKA